MAAEPTDDVQPPADPPKQIVPPKRKQKESPHMAEKAAETKAFETEFTMALMPMAGFDNALKCMALARSSAEMVLEAFQGTVRHGYACQEAGLRFTRDRLQKGIDYGNALSGCRSVADIVGAAAEFSRGTVEDTVNHSRDLGAMTVELVNESLAPVQTRTEAAIEQVRKAA